MNGLKIGIVKDNADPTENGRLRVFIPGDDSTHQDIENLPWARYVSPFGGTTADFLAGRDESEISGMSTYGMWAIPKNGSQVLIGFINDDKQSRVWLGCIYQPNLIGTLPQSVNSILPEVDESGMYPQKTIKHYKNNLTEAGLEESSLHFESRGGYERSVSSKSFNDGYYPKPLQKDRKDSQIYSITTPGRHYMTMSDVAEHCRIRFKTTEGSQILLDDTNERIYISTAKGRNWIELDETNGKIYIHSDSKINIASKNDLNFYSDENINIVAKNRINIQSLNHGIKLQSNKCIDLSSLTADIKLSSSRSIHLKTSNGGSSGPISSNEEYQGVAKGFVYTHADDGGSVNSGVFIHGSEYVSIQSDNKVLVNANSEIDITSSSKLSLSGDDLATSFGTVSGLTPYDSHNAPGKILSSGNGSSETVSTNSVNQEDVISTMIIPQHESWERDNDEKKHKTPRNKYWKP